MTDDHDLQHRLERLGSTDGPTAGRAFADRLDADLRVMHAQRPSHRSARSPWVPTLAGAAVAVLAVVSMVVLLRNPSTDVVMTAAADTEIIIPGRQSTEAMAGQRLPDGTRIEVGPDGEAVVDGVVLGPGSAAVVVGGRVDVVTALDPPADGASPADGSDGNEGGGGDEQVIPPISPPDSPTTTRPGADRTTVGPSTSDRDRTTATTSAGSAPPSSSTTTTRPTTASTAPTSTGSTAPTTTTEAPEPLTLTITAIGQARLRLDWILEADVVPAGWRVRLASADRVSTLVVIRGADARSATIERAVASGATLWVEALDRDGGVLLASDPVDPPAP